ncbi:peroxide stress protein YaaA [Enterococcus columbae]|uniref:UPF0246 protein I568_02029 n=1 Tax=Enterococcus columbae DSM 7374 = ATCC 51263 TaxID=1121865 RepID=S1NHS1_9ENTE|nr:peroxide stress protein YaaA [Enterococcus columbae]EOT40553.1 hypothetical protein OMW_01415 [Enterococcus columbae DSM 7374 = ATCC 51263]EOW80329.1 hypothetical protein I568_02029 [Enterococcus columbae DSM 7374 = ATCC 51263]OJG25513.1 hypothetical protein RR47_GL001562 [Enterococcus columbae DSM 7374 = ATCC 51263]
MIILLPTAKELNTQVISVAEPSQKLLTQEISQAFAKLSVEELVAIYKIKESLAQDVYQQWQAIVTHQAQYYPAWELFDGLMYRQIKRTGLSDKQLNYVDKHLYLTSALYGVIGATSGIAPHRLDFQQRIKINQQSLKQNWQPYYDEAVQNETPILSLLSSEFDEVFSKEIRKNFYRCLFIEKKADKERIHSTISKKARGKLVNCCIQKQLQTIDEIKKLTFDGFCFQPLRSSEHELVFIKNA